jgi:hypothetical protein
LNEAWVRSEFPRVYRLGPAYRIFTQCFGIGFAALWVGLIADQPTGERIAMGVLFCLLSVYLVAFATRVCVIQRSDHIEARWVFVRRRMYRRDIAARRLVTADRGQTALRLYSRSGAGDLTLPANVKTDAAFEAWFEETQPPTTTE